MCMQVRRGGGRVRHDVRAGVRGVVVRACLLALWVSTGVCVCVRICSVYVFVHAWVLDGQGCGCRVATRAQVVLGFRWFQGYRVQVATRSGGYRVQVVMGFCKGWGERSG